ncbi:quinolinate synthase NadA [bacterium]|nr:quinolinate synthase NadA [candidate division CSSED10-310 bacterium]
MDNHRIQHKILDLKKQHDAAILVHNYQRPEIQELADYLGDSLDLARRAMMLPQPVIVFCGVHFMAESAAILAPEKTILLPHPDAGCPLADCASPDRVRDARKQHPDAVFIAYINTSAAVKAEVDVVCTSANALRIIKRLSDREICYLPDKNLAAYAAEKLGIRMIPWPGQCYVHDHLIDLETVERLKEQNPGAVVMAHPEASPAVLKTADIVTGTSGMIREAISSRNSHFIVVTERGLVERMRREIPGKTFIPIPTAVCSQMKLTTLETVLDSLQYFQHVISVPGPVAVKARRSLDRMLELSE